MSDFNDVKVGDIVLHEVSGARVGFSNPPTFWVPIRVEKVTTTQFVTEDGVRYRKTDGQKTGGYAYAVKVGDMSRSWGGGVYRDETEKLRAHNERVRLWNTCRNQIDALLPLVSHDKSDLPALSVALDAALAAAKNEVPSE